MTTPYPLRFHPLLFEKVWGGRRLERWNKSLPTDRIIGEAWEVADLDATSASGAGGQAAHSVIENGPLKGATIRDALHAWGPDLTGFNPPPAFPLLVKLLDARENLSVQVHPSPAYAAAHPDARLKTECWCVLEAEPGSVIYKGVRPGVTRDDFQRHIRDGSVAHDLLAVPALPGDVHNLPSGTVHALGAGVLVAEVQTPSDTTFRVFDWGRTGRALHIEQALECIDFAPAPNATRLRENESECLHVTTDFFDVREHRLHPTRPLTFSKGHCVVVICIAGRARLSALDLPRGTTAVIPASAPDRTVIAADSPCRLLTARLKAP